MLVPLGEQQTEAITGGMVVTFLSDHPLGYIPGTQTPVSAGASARLRVLLPAQQLKRHGWTTNIVGLCVPVSQRVFNSLSKASYVVVSKIFRQSSLDLIAKLSSLGVKIVVDYCDNHLDNGDFKEIHHRLLKLAERCIANTPAMHQVLRQHRFQGPINIIEDMVEHQIIAARAPPRLGQVNLIAFGSKYVCKHLQTWLPALKDFASRQRPLTLEVVTLIDNETIKWEKSFRSLNGDGFRFSISQWNEIGMEQAFRRADVAIIPSEQSEFNRTKSANRLLEATSAGLPVIAWPIEPYHAYKDTVAVTEDLLAGLSDVLKHPERTIRRIHYTQQLVKIRHDSEQIGLQWHSLFSALSLEDDRKLKVSPTLLYLQRGIDNRILSSKFITEECEVETGFAKSIQSSEKIVSAIEFDDALLSSFNEQGIPDWVESRSEKSLDLENSPSIDAAKLCWSIPRIFKYDFPTGTVLFKQGYLSQTVRALDRMVLNGVFTEFEQHEFLYSKYQISNPWIGRMPGAYWRERAIRLSRIFSVLNKQSDMGDESFNLEFYNILFDYLAGYLIIKHVFNSNLIEGVNWIDTDKVTSSRP
jgi:glycosyltransferase involved in cell wall biosynthesis